MKSLLHKNVLFVLILAGTLSSGQLWAQRGKNGSLTISAANTVVNAYTPLSADAAAGTTSITVTNNSLNTHFSSNLAAGDLIMIIQMQGASILGVPSNTIPPNPPFPAIGVPTDSTWGTVTNYNNCGNWEFAEVKSVAGTATITVNCPLKYSYSQSGKTQVLRVPRYSFLTINTPGSITCDTWNGNVGGVCAIEVVNNTIINAGASIDVSGKGFRGGQILDNTNQLMNLPYASSNSNVDGAEKGEGIAGYKNDYTQYGGMYMRGAAANAGGGGNIHNAGGGGGANGGNIASWTGIGVPNTTSVGYTAAWNLEFAGLSGLKSSGGGRGGYSFSSKINNPTTQAPGNATIWGGQGRFPVGGYGGRPLDYTLGKLFLGGGGGSGDQNDNSGGEGANGGGLIYLMNYGQVSGTGQLISNGNAGSNTKATENYKDGAGGGGAGGTIVVNAIGSITGISLIANGGKGGDQLFTSPLEPQAEGPGGGGGGGFIAISNGTPTRTTNGGVNGITNSNGVSEFPPNGATAGGVGTNTATVTNFIITAANTTICSGQSTTLTVNITPAQVGTTVIWYDALVGGNVIGNGATYTVSPIITTTYYVGSCPGTYHQPVVVTVTSSIPPIPSGNITICSGSSATLTVSGASSYIWLTNPIQTNSFIIVSPSVYTTYTVTSGGACQGTATVSVNVGSNLAPTTSGDTTICTGTSATLTAFGASSYLWSTNETTNSITVTPTKNTIYTVTSGGACPGTAIISVFLASSIPPQTSGDTTICTGTSATLTAFGASSYLWSTNETTNSITVTPTKNTIYTVTSGGACPGTANVSVIVATSISPTISSSTTICSGSSATLTASGVSNYLWSTGETTNSITVTPSTDSVYTVAYLGPCSGTSSVSVSVVPSPTITVSNNTTICSGDATTLIASGGVNYLWINNGASTSVIIVSPSSLTTYSVSTTIGTCSDIGNVTVSVLPKPIATIIGNNICQGFIATLTATGGGTYLWNTNETTKVINPTATGNYSVTVSLGTCTVTAVKNIVVNPNPTATAFSDVTIFQGQSANLSATGGIAYVWDNSMTGAGIKVSPLNTTIYCVTVYDANKCYDTACVTVRVEQCSNAGYLYLPNAFSPNGDGENDNLEIYHGAKECVKLFYLVLYNRWGEKIYETNDPAFKWNGIYNSGLFKNTNQGGTEVYVYYLNAETVDGIKVSKKGNISLVR
jgi:gliding motility-associated-like protein